MAVRSRSSGERTSRTAPRRAASAKKSAGTPRPKRETAATAAKPSKAPARAASRAAAGAKRPKASVKAASPAAVDTAVDTAGPLRCTERTADYKVLVFGSSCTLEEAGELRAGLLDALADGTPLVLDGSAIERIDTAGLQLLVGLSFECMERGIGFAWRARSEALKDAIALTGLAPLMESPTPVALPATA